MSSRDELERNIAGQLEALGVSVEELRLQPGRREGAWELEVVSDDFRGMSRNEREAMVRPALDVHVLNRLDLLTSGETEWTDQLPERPLAQLPLWPEALKRGRESDRIDPAEIVFPSDLDSDLERPISATFYSLRGGVGRSTGLAYTARILADRDLKVVCIDMDLEAPGLASLFGVEDKARTHPGVVDLLLDFDYGEIPDLSDALIPVTETDDLYCISGGVPGVDHARKLRFVEPEHWYREDRNPMRIFAERLAEDLPFTPDVLLYDARTGMNTLNAPLLFDLSDLAFITFFPHPQAKRGTEALVQSLLLSKTARRQDDVRFNPEPRFIVSPMPASRMTEVLNKYEKRGLEWVSDWLAPLTGEDSESDLVESEITHFVPYQEQVATSDDIFQTDRRTWDYYEPIADWIDGLIPTGRAEDLEGVKTEILEELEFSAGTAETIESLEDVFVKTGIVQQAMARDVPLVRGRKGAGKTALFRQLAEDDESNHIAVMAPSHLRSSPLLSQDGFKAVEDAMYPRGTKWREFWIFYTAVVVYQELLSIPELGDVPGPEDAALNSWLQKNAFKREKQIVSNFEVKSQRKRFGLQMRSWLLELDATVSQLPGQKNEETTPSFLLFDGLDTGFGQTREDRERREKALEGLFSFVNDVGASLEHLQFKVFLREDIWKRLTFENKSHFFGRSVALIWEKQEEFLKVVMTQAVKSERFWELVRNRVSGGRENVEHWGKEDVLTAWKALLGERMRGAKTAFTKNWVWNRLADSNDNHSPRYLVELFRGATKWERDEQRHTPFFRTVIRPRALIKVFPSVSQQAVDALREEFPELESLLKAIEKTEKTIFDADKLGDCKAENIKLAREIGLLEVYEGTEDKVAAYRVPELYRYGLSLKRKGPA